MAIEKRKGLSISVSLNIFFPFSFNGDLNLVILKRLIRKESDFLYSKQEKSVIPRNRFLIEQQEKIINSFQMMSKRCCFKSCL